MVLLVGAESAWRAWRAQPRGRVGEWLAGVLLIVVGVTIAGGLGMLVGGGRPREPLHFVYAILAFGAVPVASSIARRAPPRREALATLIGAVVALVLIARLFQTG
jgi:hypothetical protein